MNKQGALLHIYWSELGRLFAVLNWRSTVGNEKLRTTRLNSYHLNLKKQKFRTEIRKNFFTNRVVDEWNKLPTSVKDSKTVNEFKTKIYKHNFI